MSSAASIRSGELRHQVYFERDAGTKDDGGSVVPVWRPVGNPFRCSITPLSGTKQLLAMQAQARVTHTIVMRYRQGIDPHWRIRYGVRVFEIVSVTDVEERHRKIEILAAEVPLENTV